MGRRVPPARSGQPRTVRRLVVTLGEERFRSASSTLSIRVLTADLGAEVTPDALNLGMHETPHPETTDEAGQTLDERNPETTRTAPATATLRTPCRRRHAPVLATRRGARTQG